MARAMAPMAQWPQIMVTTDGNKIHQSVAFPGITFQNFMRIEHSPLPTPRRSVFRSFRSLIVVCRLCRGPKLIKN